MEVIKRSARGYAQDPTKYFNFNRFSSQGSRDVALVEAAFEESNGWEQFELSPEQIQNIREKKIVRLEFEEPNKFFIGDNPNRYDGDFYRVYTLCPFTAKWLNQEQGVRRRIPVFFPFNEEYIPDKAEKIYDVIYTGHIVAPTVLRDIKIISKFNYRFVSNSDHTLVTDHSVSYERKMELIAQTRITILSNLLYPRFRHLLKIWGYPNWRKNEAFKELPPPSLFFKYFTERSRMVVPQLKSRLFEAAFGKSLILCKLDSFNIIENYFEPEKEFIYYKEGELELMLNKILSSFEKYKDVVERAYKRAISEYTTKCFFDKYLGEMNE